MILMLIFTTNNVTLNKYDCEDVKYIISVH